MSTRLPSTLLIAFLIGLTNCNDKLDLNLLTHDCLETRAIAADYDTLGHIFNIGNLSVYEYDPPNNPNKKRLLIGVYDIYGWENTNLMQVTDEMAVQMGGFMAVLPDFFRGDYWDVDRNDSERQEWADRVTDWNKTVKWDLINLLHYYQDEGVKEFGIFGMCYGAQVATFASTELSEYFKASAVVHPSFLTGDEAKDVKVPMYLMPANGDLDMSEFYVVLQSKFGDNCGHRRFDDMIHGFTGARGNFSDPLVRERTDEVIEKLGVFFDRNLNETKQDNNSSSSAKLRPYILAISTIIVFIFFK